MENLDSRILALQQEMQEQYASGDKSEALKTSQQLDRLIALRQREMLLLSSQP